MTDVIKELEKVKNNAYWERNQLVAALSKLFPAHLAKHPETDKDWEDDWRTIVVVYIPVEINMQFRNGDKVEEEQLTWHIHDSEVPMFDHLQYQEHFWDGHTTEEKYRRLRRVVPLNNSFWWSKYQNS